MMRQKNSTPTLKRIVFPKREAKSHSGLSHYGPPSTPDPFIQPLIGYMLSKYPLGLRKVKRKVVLEKVPRVESNAYVVLKAGEANLCKRFRRLKYLESWKSKKVMYNVCEQNLISKMHENLSKLELKRKSMSLSHFKTPASLS